MQGKSRTSITMKDVASRAGVSVGTVSRVINNEKGIKKATLAVAYGFKRQEVTNILSGTTKGPRANSFILQVIEDYGIE